MREAKLNFEQSLAQEAKDDPRTFFNYRSRISTREEVTRLERPNGTLITNNHESFEVLNEALRNVVKRETDDPSEDIVQYAGMELQVCNFQANEGEQLLGQLESSSVPGAIRNPS